MLTATERLTEYRQKKDPSKAVLSNIQALKGDPGKDGYTPRKGVDYFTPSEIQEIFDVVEQKIRSFGKGLKGEPGLQGKPGKDGKDGIGIQGPKGEDGLTPIHGIHYFTKKDQDILINRLLAKIKVPQVHEIVAEVKKVPFDYKEIKNAPDLKDLPALIAFLRAGGFRGGAGNLSSIGTPVDNEVVSGSGTTFTLANTPIAGSVKVYALGQRLVLTTDYSISGKVITTVNSWLTGQIVADYRM